MGIAEEDIIEDQLKIDEDEEEWTWVRIIFLIFQVFGDSWLDIESLPTNFKLSQ